MANSNPKQPQGSAIRSAQQVRQQFERRYGASSKVRMFQAPGRVNLIGEHTDYNDGFVMPAAIDFHTWVAAEPVEGNGLEVYSADFDEAICFELSEHSPSPRHHWSDYVIGVVLQLQREGVPVRGGRMVIAGNVPIGSGLSSSASIEVAVAYALAALAKAEVDPRSLALLCQRAENEFVGARCGIMDQFISVHGRSGHALMLDCRSLDYRYLPLPAGVSLVVCNTMVKHSVASGEYNTRRRECEEGVARLRQALPGIQALRDISLADLERHHNELPALIYRRCRHVVAENERVLAAAEALQRSDLEGLGRLMRQSHESLRDDYEVSCAELDFAAETAWSLPGVIGARMTGGGFGGCTINLVQDGAVETFKSEFTKAYQAKFGISPEIYVSKASDGVSEVTAGGNESGRGA